jgi:disease resistance protein RPM1
MAHLLAGNKSKRIALTLSEGITKMTALQTLYGIEIILSKDLCPLAALENLANLKKLTIYKLVRPNINDDAVDVLQLQSAIEHLSSCSLKFLTIDDDFTGFLDRWLEESKAPPEHLHTLGLLGKLSQVPKWVGNLHNLEKLTLSLTALRTEALQVLCKLPQLFSLIFSLDAAKNDASILNILHKNTLESGGRVIVPEGFNNLKLLRFVGLVMPALSFMQGAMPALQMLELRFLMMESLFGLENLESLQQVVLAISSQAHEDAKAKAHHMAEMIANGPRVAVYEYN